MEDTEIKPYPLITQAVRTGDISELKLLFSRFPSMLDLRVPGFGSWLHYSAGHGTLEIVDYLVGMGFDVNASDHLEGQRPLSSAAYRDNYDIAEYLIRHGAVMDVSLSILNPLFAAIVGRSVSIVKLLLNYGIDLNARYTSGTMKNVDATAFAILRGELEIAKLIAQHGSCGNQHEMDRRLREAEIVAKEST